MDKDSLNSYLDAAVESSDRSRKVLLVLATVCILMGSAIWNSQIFSWKKQRIDCVGMAVETLCKSQNNGSTLPSECAGIDRSSIVISDQNQANECAKHYAENIPSVAIATYKTLKDEYSKQVLSFNVQSLGISFDINDISLIGGISLVILLYILQSCSYRELLNLDRLFDYVEKYSYTLSNSQEKKDIQQDYYRRLAMRQVFTLPPSSTESTPKYNPPRGIRSLSNFLLSLPVILQLCAFITDCFTHDVGIMVSQIHYCTHMTAALFLLGLMLYVTYLVLDTGAEIDKLWGTKAAAILELQEQVELISIFND